ncbi:hypothetical protein ACI3L1_06610 [Deinococcus sp. SM5_A1]|uniref:hypothetical protein n=1 Tax=Deinococcus sp. SM5_A1 TaxID=3379094 RepID=UPI00385FCB08
MSGTIIRAARDSENPYAQISRNLFEDERISWRSKGLMGYLLSRKDGWKIYVADLQKRSTDGRDACYAALDELGRAGYLERNETREKGRIKGTEYVIWEVPDSIRAASWKTVSGKAVSGKAVSGSAVSGKSSTSNKSLKSITEERITEEKKTLVADATAHAPSQDLPELDQEHPTGFPQPSGQPQQQANAQSDHATSQGTVPGGAAGPVEKPVDNSRPAVRQTAYVQIVAAWNAHCAPLPQVETVNDGRRKSVRKLLTDCGEDVGKAVQTVTDAAHDVARDPFWLERRYGFDNLVPGKVFARAEAWRSRSPDPEPDPAAPTPSMAELMAAAPLNPLPGGRK